MLYFTSSTLLETFFSFIIYLRYIATHYITFHTIAQKKSFLPDQQLHITKNIKNIDMYVIRRRKQNLRKMILKNNFQKCEKKNLYSQAICLFSLFPENIFHFSIGIFFFINEYCFYCYNNYITFNDYCLLSMTQFLLRKNVNYSLCMDVFCCLLCSFFFNYKTVMQHPNRFLITPVQTQELCCGCKCEGPIKYSSESCKNFVNQKSVVKYKALGHALEYYLW